MESNNKKLIFLGFTFLFFCGFLVTAIGVYEHIVKLNQIQLNPVIVTATIKEEVITKSTEIQTVGFKLEYYYEGNLYVINANGLVNHKTGDKIKIMLEKDNPENFILTKNIDYTNTLIFSLCCFILSTIMFIFRNRVIPLWRKVAPEY